MSPIVVVHRLSIIPQILERLTQRIVELNLADRVQPVLGYGGLHFRYKISILGSNSMVGGKCQVGSPLNRLCLDGPGKPIGRLADIANHLGDRPHQETPIG